MADVALNTVHREPGVARDRVLRILLALAVLLCVAKPVLPDFLIRLPEAWIPPAADWLDYFFNVIVIDTLHINQITRWFAEVPLEFMLGFTANLLEGKHRWPYLSDPLPWSSITAVAVVTGY
ncbi:MAG: glycine/betaine ABC transporter permease, partial [Roseovarius sp.]